METADQTDRSQTAAGKPEVRGRAGDARGEPGVCEGEPGALACPCHGQGSADSVPGTALPAETRRTPDAARPALCPGWSQAPDSHPP